MTEFAETDRILDLKLDEKNVIRRSRDIEHERSVAMYDLLDRNRFKLVDGRTGPYIVHLALDDDGKRLVFTINDEKDEEMLEQGNLLLTPFRAQP